MTALLQQAKACPTPAAPAPICGAANPGCGRLSSRPFPPFRPIPSFVEPPERRQQAALPAPRPIEILLHQIALPHSALPASPEAA